MVSSNFGLCAFLELIIVVCQVFGVATLACSRLASSPTHRDWGRMGFVVALVGLGIAGAICGRHDSEFALFAGGTMTLLLIGMTAGSSVSDMTVAGPTRVKADSHLAA